MHEKATLKWVKWGQKKRAWGRIAVSRPGQLIVARVTIQTCMNEKLQQCGGAITSLTLVCVRWHYLAGWGAITALFAAPEEKVSFCLWPKELKVLQMFYIRYKKVQL